jgi:xanthine dehydrogenase accessory factor
MTDPELLKILSENIASGGQAALLTVTGFEDSVPRETGAKMIVFSDGKTAGSIGGGRLEAQAIEDALESIKEGLPRHVLYTLEPKTLGMYCGGKIKLFIDVFADPLKLIILGGGHVGEKTAALASFLGIPYWVVDDRPEYACRQRFPQARAIEVSQPDVALKRLALDSRTAIAILTRCHGFDLRCLVAALQTPAFYIGLIASRPKTQRLFELCRRHGPDPESDHRVRAPIGLDLGAETPETIALSILAEIMQVRHQASGKPLSELQAIPVP